MFKSTSDLLSQDSVQQAVQANPGVRRAAMNLDIAHQIADKYPTYKNKLNKIPAKLELRRQLRLLNVPH